MRRVKYPGFTIIELLVVIGIVALLVSLVLPALAKSRRSARQVACSVNLQQHGQLLSSYASSNRDSIASFSWKPQSYPSFHVALDSDIRAAIQDAQSPRVSHIAQWISIIRKYGDEPEQPLPLGHLPHVRSNHLPLAVDAGVSLKDPVFQCPEDSTRKRWLIKDSFLQDLPSIVEDRYAFVSNIQAGLHLQYTSSYIPTASAYQSDVGQDLYTISSNRGWSGRDNNSIKMGHRRYFDVSFPSSKVHIFDDQQRHTRSQTFYASPGATQPVLLFDGSVRVLSNSDAHKGVMPQMTMFEPAMAELFYARLNYTPSRPMGDGGPFADNLPAYYLYTAGGLKGVDFGAMQIDTRFVPR